MSSTVTNFSNNINTTYPVPGVDNDTQGFRDNFSNIKNALNAAAADLSYLQTNTAKLDAGRNDFNYNQIFKATLIASGHYSPNIDNITSSTTINFLQGNYQKFSVQDNTTLSISNWPANTVHGSLKLELYNANSSTVKTISFNGITNKPKSLTLPFELTTSSWNKPVIFELWSSDGGNTIFIDKILDSSTDLVPFMYDPSAPAATVAVASYSNSSGIASTVSNATQTSITTLGTLTNLEVNGTITINEMLSLQEANLTVNNNNIIISGVSGLTIENPTSFTATVVGSWGVGPIGTTYIDLDSQDDISVGSTFKLDTSEDLLHVVKSVDNVTSLRKRVYVNQYDENAYVVADDITGQIVNIKNGNLYNSVYYSSSEPIKLYGKPGDKKGGVYITDETVYLSKSDYINTTTNIWVEVPSLLNVQTLISNTFTTFTTVTSSITALANTVTNNTLRISVLETTFDELAITTINSNLNALNISVNTNTSRISTIENTMVRYASSAPLSNIGSVGDKKGTIYANTTTMYICFQDYVGGSIPCWAKTSISTTPW